MAALPNDSAIMEAVNEQNDDGQKFDTQQLFTSEKYMMTNGELDLKNFPKLAKINQEVIHAIYRSTGSDLNILVAGVTGSGKSSLANAIVGSDVFSEGGDLNACTEHVTHQKTEKLEVLRIWDSPGLLDGKNCDATYLKEIGCILNKFKPGDLILFCIRAQVRFRGDRSNEDILGMLKLKKAFGDTFVKNLVIVLTYADAIPGRAGRMDKKEYYKDRILEFKVKIRQALESQLKLKTAENIQIIPVQHHTCGDTLPDGTRWLSSLWFECLNIVPDEYSQAKWIEHFQDRIVDTPDSDSEKARYQLVLADEFLPKKLLEYKRENEIKGGGLGVLGLLGGPLALITIPMGIWGGSRYGERKYLRELQTQKQNNLVN